MRRRLAWAALVGLLGAAALLLLGGLALRVYSWREVPPPPVVEGPPPGGGEHIEH